MKLNRIVWILAVAAMLALAILVACTPAATPAPPAPAEEPAAPAEEPAEAPEEPAEPEEPAPPAEEPAAKPQLTITWLVWPPCDMLAELVKDYPDADVRVNCVPFPQWHDVIFNDFVARGGADLPILDSQWTGEAYVGGHLVELTDFLKTRTDFDDWLPNALEAYAEYPEGSGRYWGMPFFPDVQLLVYNKNILAEYGIDEPADTWEGVLAQAQTIKAGGEYEGWVWFYNINDQIQLLFNQIAWSYGGALWDPQTYMFEGVINSPQNVASLELLTEFYQAGPEGAGEWSFPEVTTAMCDGTAAMTTIWVAILTGWTDPAECKEFPNLGFAVPPRGPVDHVLSLGGMGMNLSAYSQNQEAALDFLEWLASEETQLRWVELGSYSASAKVLESDTFLNASVLNPYFAEAYPLVRDFYRIPEYFELENIQGIYVNLAVTGQMSAQEALDKIAEESQAILDEAYPDGPPQ